EMQIQKAIELGDTEEYLLKILGEPRKVAEKFIAEEIAEEEAEPEQETRKTGLQPVTGSFASDLKNFSINQLAISGERADIKIEKTNNWQSAEREQRTKLKIEKSSVLNV